MFGKYLKLWSLLIACFMLLSLPAGALAASHTTSADEAAEATEADEETASTEPIVTQTKVTETGTPLDSLSVSYWPEYDDPSVLVMYRGRVDASINTPAQLKIAIPKGADVRLASTSAIDTNNQFQYDRAWNSKQITDAGDMQILTYEIIFPQFQFEIYMNNVSGGGKRDFNFDLPSISNIKNLSVDIRKPVRAEKFKAIPAAASTSQDGQFENHLYSFADVAPGQKYAFNVTYERADSKPSVDKQTGVVDTSGGSQTTAIFVIFGITLLGLAVAAGVWRMKSAPVTPTRGRPVKAKPITKSDGQGKGKGKNKNKSQGTGNSGGTKFCSDCGEKIGPKDKFCPGCGSSL